jgi:hypothetical protein
LSICGKLIAWHLESLATVSVFPNLGAPNRDVRFTAMSRHRQLGRSGPKSATRRRRAAYSISSSELASNVQLRNFLGETVN